jgi:hypothetical protein
MQGRYRVIDVSPFMDPLITNAIARLLGFVIGVFAGLTVWALVLTA